MSIEINEASFEALSKISLGMEPFVIFDKISFFASAIQGLWVLVQEPWVCNTYT